MADAPIEVISSELPVDVRDQLKLMADDVDPRDKHMICQFLHEIVVTGRSPVAFWCGKIIESFQPDFDPEKADSDQETQPDSQVGSKRKYKKRAPYVKRGAYRRNPLPQQSSHDLRDLPKVIQELQAHHKLYSEVVKTVADGLRGQV
jgi:hypothetical protein